MDHESDRQNRRDALVKLMRLGALGANGAGLGVWLNARSKRLEKCRLLTFQRRGAFTSTATGLALLPVLRASTSFSAGTTFTAVPLAQAF